MPNLIEEVESVGRSDFKAFVGAIKIVIAHMLKWDHQPAKRGDSWTDSIEEHRARATLDLEDSPSYTSRLNEAIERAHRLARFKASRETGLPLSTFSESCPYSWDEIMTRPHRLYDERG